MSALRVAAGHDRGFPFEIEDVSDGSRLAKFVSQEEAFRFIRAVNSHDALVSAAEQVRGWCIPGMNWTDDIGQVLLKQLDDALARAKGEPS